MKLKPMMSYYGSKWRLAPKYPEPVHDTIIEPFAGGAGYSLRHHERNVILVEKSPVVSAVWQYLIDASPSDILGLPLLGEGQSVDDFDLSDPEKWFIGFWLHGASEGAPKKRLSKWGILNLNSRGSAGYWGETCRARLASQVDKIKHWRIINASYQDFTYEGNATWFVDPPYQVKGKHYPEGSGAIDFDHLGKWCKGLHGQVIVCENDGAYWLPFVPFAEQLGTNQGGKLRQSKEVVWLSVST
jgi:hypothetical protein